MSLSGLIQFGTSQRKVPVVSAGLRGALSCALWALVVASPFMVVGANPASAESLTIVDKNGVLMPVWGSKKAQDIPASPVAVPALKDVPNVVEQPDVVPLEVVPVTVGDGAAQSVDVPSAGDCTQKFSSRKQGQSLSIAQGNYLSKQLNEWARFHGYNLVWEADEYMAQGNVKFDGSFEEMLEKFRESMEENGIGLDVSVYRNCVVRITARK